MTDWLLDKVISDEVAPNMASWAAADIVNGPMRSFWLKNNLIANNGGQEAKDYSVNWALQGHGVLLHPELVVEVALIRPGPIQGQSVHPYLRRRNGEEDVRYPHPSTEPILEKTLGVPIFQEQLMELARICAGFDGSQADRLRQAMTHKRSDEAMGRLREEVYEVGSFNLEPAGE